MSSRRQFATAALAALSAGCLGDGPGRLGSKPTSDTEPSGDSESTGDPNPSSDDCASGVTLSTEPFEPIEQLSWPLRDAARELVERAASTGGATVETVATDPGVPDGGHVELDGTYHRIEVTATGRTTVPAVTLDLSWEAGREPPSDASVVAYDDLPASDRAVLDLVVHGPRNEREGFPAEAFEATDAPAPYPDGTEGSTLVAREHVWVEWEDRAFEVRVGEETTDTVRTFDVAAPVVAESDAAFREYAADRYVVALDGLTAGERTILESAVSGGYEACEPAPADYERLQSRLPEDRELPHPSDDRWYVAYDGERYQFEFRLWEQ